MPFGRADFNWNQVRERFASSVLGGVALMVFTLFAATSAQAVTYIPFDGPEFGGLYSYGYDWDAKTYPTISTFNEFSTFEQATTSDSEFADSSLLHVDLESFEGCPSTDLDNCSDTYNVFDVVWKVTFQAEQTDDPALPYDVHLILVDSDPSTRFVSNIVSVDYGSGSLGTSPSDLQSLTLQTAKLDNLYFVDLALGTMLDDEVVYVGVTYRVLGSLPLADPSQPGFLFPQLVPAAYVTVIPEPGTASMLGLGLTALALIRKRA